MNLKEIIPADVFQLESHFQAEGFTLVFVGGFPRDLRNGTKFKDIDMATDATPDEQIAIYTKYGVKYHETGLQHGTISVVLDSDVYEITTFRTESEHDGRHAVVAYTRDLMEDLGRRDLTINAIAMTFNGELIDPYNGAADLDSKIVRFVGNPDERMIEDYLRILRFVRFHARIAGGGPMDQDTCDAVMRNAHGLRDISRERVWMEMAKIIAGPAGPDMVQAIFDLEIATHIDFPNGDIENLRRIHEISNDPCVLMVAFLKDEQTVAKIAQDWKWSAAERDRSVFLAKTMGGNFTNYTRLMAHDGFSKEWVVDLATLDWGKHNYVDYLRNWAIPVFPVAGKDLLAIMSPGKAMGERLKVMKAAWADSGYTMTKEDLMGKY